jgi:hypothetical protein
MQAKVKARLLKWIGGPSQDEIDVDEILGLLLQISLAIMMIFMIAFFMFRFKSNKAQQEQLIEIQRQKITVSLEKNEQFFRTRYGLNSITRMDEKGDTLYQMEGLISNGEITDNVNLRFAFVDGGKRAYQDYSDIMTLRQTWWMKVLTDAEMAPADLTQENWKWLAATIDEKIKNVKANCTEVQLLAAVAVQSHFITSPEKVTDADVQRLLKHFIRASDVEQRLIIPELTTALRKQSFHYLEKQAGIPMLENLK